jgi:hypothetical protein
MASAEKRLAAPDAATLALWRVAEHGEVDELSDVLRRVPDINACNEHGVTVNKVDCGDAASLMRMSSTSPGPTR